MDFKMVNSFCWPIDDIVEILASGEEPVSMESLTCVSSYKVCDFRKTGEGFLKTIEWSVRGQIPSFAKKVIHPDKLKFNEETSWNNDAATFTTKVTPHFLKDKIKCMIVVQWGHDGEGKSRRTVDCNVKVRVPFIGNKLERMIAEILKENNEKYANLLNTSFANHLGQPGDYQKTEG